MTVFRRHHDLTPDERARLPDVLGPLDRFEGDDREVLARLTALLLHRPDWTPSKGFVVDDDMRFVVAATAAVLGVGVVDHDPFGNVHAVVVHPTTMVDRQARATPMRGVVTEAPRAMTGHTTAHGPVFIAWNAVVRDRRTGRSSVILHEFAHKLDAADAVMDGTPWLDRSLRPRWIEVCTRVYEQVRSGPPDPVLRRYAGTNPTEFFAVATESFFTRPLDLVEHHPDLYDVFAAAYRQDPATVDRDRHPTDPADAPH